MRRVTGLIIGVVLGAMILGGCSSASGGSSGSQADSPNGELLVSEKCTRCHSLDRIQGARKSAEDWQETVSRMQGNGLRITDAEKAAIVDYLAATYAQ